MSRPCGASLGLNEGLQGDDGRCHAGIVDAVAPQAAIRALTAAARGPSPGIGRADASR